MKYQSDDEFLRSLKVQPLGTPKRRLVSREWIDKALSVEEASYQHQVHISDKALVEGMDALIQRLQEKLARRGHYLAVAATLLIWLTVIEIIRMVYGFAQ
jgi:hypothetical protein